MMSIDKLLEIASDPLSNHRDAQSAVSSEVFGERGQELSSLLKLRNGFVAFEMALLVLPDGDPHFGLRPWNQMDGWRENYEACLPESWLCFACDLFGTQFCLGRSGICMFYPETGEIEYYAETLDEWASNLLQNYSEDTGWPLAHEWQTKNRPLHLTERLLPKLPFVLGGDFEVSNLVAVESNVAMQKYSELYQLISNAPDGSVVELENWI